MTYIAARSTRLISQGIATSAHYRVCGVAVPQPALANVAAWSAAHVHAVVHAAAQKDNVEVFVDSLEMADHLFTPGYKDSAAMLERGFREERLRQLCGR